MTLALLEGLSGRRSTLAGPRRTCPKRTTGTAGSVSKSSISTSASGSRNLSASVSPPSRIILATSIWSTFTSPPSWLIIEGSPGAWLLPLRPPHFEWFQQFGPATLERTLAGARCSIFRHAQRLQPGLSGGRFAQHTPLLLPRLLSFHQGFGLAAQDLQNHPGCPSDRSAERIVFRMVAGGLIDPLDCPVQPLPPPHHCGPNAGGPWPGRASRKRRLPCREP